MTRRLTAAQTHRLYEALGNVAEGVPPLSRRALVAVWRRVAWRLPDTDWHCAARKGLRQGLSDLVKPDWTWILKVLPDDGAADVFWRWATDAGYVRRTST